MSVARSLIFLVGCIVNRFIFLSIRFIFNFVQHLWWHYTGICADLQSAAQPRHLRRSAHVINIIWTNHFDYLQPYTMSDFICTHNRFESPDYVLRDNVSVFFLLEDAVVFAETEPEVQTWRSKYGAFQREANEKYAKRLIVLPYLTLEKLGEKLGPPTERLVFLFNTPRCGSTLLAQMMEATGRCVSISEPDGLNYIATRYRENGNTEALRKLTTSFVHLQCKPVKDPRYTTAFIIKLTSSSAVALPLFSDLFPKSTFLFMYRDVVNVAKSVFRVSQVMPLMLLASYGGYWSQKMVGLFLDRVEVAGNVIDMKYKDALGLGATLWCVAARQYLDFIKEGRQIKCLRYEDLVSNPLYVMKAVLQYCQLPEKYAEDSLKALECDSLKSSVLSRSSDFRAPDLTIQRETNMNEILQRFHLPKVGEIAVFDGILGWKGNEEENG